jgi:hypothetical protein
VMKEEADAYSFSMLCYEIRTGLIHFWFHERSDYDFILSGKRPELPAVVIEDLRSLLESCWHKSNKGSNSQRSGMLCFVNYGIKLACLIWHKRNQYLMIR